MSGDIFEALDSAGFGGNVREIAAEGECRVLRIDGEDGEGFMTMYRVFDGVYLMYNDLHMKSCISEYQNASTPSVSTTAARDESSMRTRSASATTWRRATCV